MKTLLPSHRCLTPPSWGTLSDINTIYTSLKSTFNGLQFRRCKNRLSYNLYCVGGDVKHCSLTHSLFSISLDLSSWDSVRDIALAVLCVSMWQIYSRTRCRFAYWTSGPTRFRSNTTASGSFMTVRSASPRRNSSLQSSNSWRTIEVDHHVRPAIDPNPNTVPVVKYIAWSIYALSTPLVMSRNGILAAFLTFCPRPLLP